MSATASPPTGRYREPPPADRFTHRELPPEHREFATFRRIANASVDLEALRRWYEDHKRFLVRTGSKSLAFSILGPSERTDDGLENSTEELEPLCTRPTAAFDGYIKEVLARFPAAYRARILVLEPGKCMWFHADHSKNVRYHLAIHTNHLSFLEYRHGLARHIPADGRFYELNTFVDHRAFNMGDSERVHLVFGVFSDRINEDLRAALQRNA